MRERAAPASGRAGLGQQPLPDGLLQRRQRVGQPGQRRGVGQLAFGAEYRRGHHQGFGVDRAGRQRGYHQRLQRPRRRPGHAGHPQRLAGQVVQQFPDMQRDAPGFLAQPLGGPVRQPSRPGQLGQRGYLPGVQALQIQPCPALGGHPHQARRKPVQPIRPDRDQAQHRVRRQPPHGKAHPIPATPPRARPISPGTARSAPSSPRRPARPAPPPAPGPPRPERTAGPARPARPPCPRTARPRRRPPRLPAGPAQACRPALPIRTRISRTPALRRPRPPGSREPP